MVAAKATGKAREFRRKVETMAVCREAAQVRLLEPFQPKPGFQPIPRKMHLDRLAKHWKRCRDWEDSASRSTSTEKAWKSARRRARRCGCGPWGPRVIVLTPRGRHLCLR